MIGDDVHVKWIHTSYLSKLAKGFTLGKKIEKFLPFIVDMRAITGQ